MHLANVLQLCKSHIFLCSHQQQHHIGSARCNISERRGKIEYAFVAIQPS